MFFFTVSSFVLLRAVSRWIILRIALPQFNGFIIFKSGWCDDVLSGMASGTQDRVGVTLKTLYNLFTLQVPNVDHVVLTAGNDPLKNKIFHLKFVILEKT